MTCARTVRPRCGCGACHVLCAVTLHVHVLHVARGALACTWSAQASHEHIAHTLTRAQVTTAAHQPARPHALHAMSEAASVWHVAWGGAVRCKQWRAISCLEPVVLCTVHGCIGVVLCTVAWLHWGCPVHGCMVARLRDCTSCLSVGSDSGRVLMIASMHFTAALRTCAECVRACVRARARACVCMCWCDTRQIQGDVSPKRTSHAGTFHEMSSSSEYASSSDPSPSPSSSSPY
jgi:hypothetical protein